MDIKEFDKYLKVLYCKANNIKDIDKINTKLYNFWILKRLHQKEVSDLFELKDSDIYSILDSCVKWYYLYGPASSIDDLLDCKDKITTCNYRLSQRLSDLFKKHELRIAENKGSLSKAMNKFSKDNMPTIAREKAKLSIYSSLMVESQYKGEIKELESLLSSLDKIVNSITQRIAWLRQDYNRTLQI